jgi:flagellar basal-body rod modification protein FlgD
MIASVNSLGSGSAAPTAGRGMDALGQGDFLRLLTVQMQQQDPFDPVDNKEMLAQMAQFSSLAGVAETNSALEQITAKLDRLIAAAEQPRFA